MVAWEASHQKRQSGCVVLFATCQTAFVVHQKIYKPRHLYFMLD